MRANFLAAFGTCLFCAAGTTSCQHAIVKSTTCIAPDICFETRKRVARDICFETEWYSLREG
ncbi:hypothetical protein PR003_g28040 [Phytophthora rubi]|uniref:Uncharacterized protein n=1 Tax=Phytophthora rubi TaxID=129364 RepID=A0A6A3HL48_9STRA|nr:hypothetical protein PR002_g26932 [Phytophthora rubi]KAE8971158.1 hypothetical protein PR001_g26974 [Phytophthora rubi]KAE9280143.1 hypothetical protein PR003_g28040 [Phytophthora rubi]